MVNPTGEGQYISACQTEQVVARMSWNKATGESLSPVPLKLERAPSASISRSLRGGIIFEHALSHQPPLKSSIFMVMMKASGSVPVSLTAKRLSEIQSLSFDTGGEK